MAKKKPQKKQRRPKTEYSKKQMEKFALRNQQIGLENALLMVLMVLSEDYGYQEDDIIKLAERVNSAAKMVDNKWVKMQDIADIVEKHSGMKFELFNKR